jgi:nicotine oxidoreductase
MIKKNSDDGNVKCGTLGLPKGSNTYGNGARILDSKESKDLDQQLNYSIEEDKSGIVVEGLGYTIEDGQLFFTKAYCTTYGGMSMLKVISDSNFDTVHNVYQIFEDIKIYQAVYWKEKSKISNMTKGIDNENIDGMSIDKLRNLKFSMENESYTVQPSKRKMIPKSNGKERPIDIPTTKDKIIQHILKWLLEAIFEKSFSDRSHGYRPNKGAHTSIKSIRNWKGITWVIEGDIENFFGSINHKILINDLHNIIKDQRIINLVWKILKAGYVLENRLYIEKSGIPQGGKIPPILSNIYLDKFDRFVEDGLKIYERTDKVNSIPNPIYIRLKSSLRKKNIDKKQKYTELRKVKSTLNIGVRCYYIRYSDDFIIGIAGTRNLSLQIKENIKRYLEDKCDIKLSSEKTKITKISNKKVEFLGYNISSKKYKEPKYIKVKKKNGRSTKKRASQAYIKIEAPYKKIKEKLIENGFIDSKFAPKAITKWIFLDHTEILYRYNYIINGLMNYYIMIDNKSIFHKIISYALRHSCALTLSRKYRYKSRKKVFEKYGKNLIDPKTNKRLNIPNDF